MVLARCESCEDLWQEVRARAFGPTDGLRMKRKKQGFAKKRSVSRVKAGDTRIPSATNHAGRSLSKTERARV